MRWQKTVPPALFAFSDAGEKKLECGTVAWDLHSARDLQTVR